MTLILVLIKASIVLSVVVVTQALLVTVAAATTTANGQPSPTHQPRTTRVSSRNCSNEAMSAPPPTSSVSSPDATSD